MYPRLFASFSPQVRSDLVDGMKDNGFSSIKPIINKNYSSFKASMIGEVQGQSMDGEGIPPMFISPLKQVKLGIPGHLIACNDGLELIELHSSQKPICVSELTSDKLIERGVAKRVN